MATGLTIVTYYAGKSLALLSLLFAIFSQIHTLTVIFLGQTQNAGGMGPWKRRSLLGTEYSCSFLALAEMLTPDVMVSGGGAFGRLSNLEDETFMTGICVYKRDPDNALCSHVKTQREVCSAWTRKCTLAGCTPSRTSSSRTVRNICLLCKLDGLILIQQPKWTKAK